MKKESLFKIGQLAKLTDMTVEAIRFYESKHLINSSSRSEGGYRLFSNADLEKLLFIKRAKAVGFSLDEISELLELRLHPDEHSCGEVKQYTANKIDQIQQKIDQLQEIQASLKTMHSACCGGAETAENCTILQILNAEKSI
ncbi:Zn(2+)-responsive transcriptional regulator [Glaciecola sp. 1036]|uniref:Zn(2+)-responsive transcriptional regulator n=1 Tax=Alteromonadaceae TaxID=72275 RepID=UPI003CFF84D1